MNITERGNLNKELFKKFKQFDNQIKPDKILTKEEQILEILKCKYNILYYINNYLRIPLSGGGSTPLLLNDKLRTVALLYQASVTTVFQTARQSSKTTIIIACSSWYINFWENTKVLFYNRQRSDNKKNLRDIKKILSLLPEWMVTYNPKIHPNNVETLRNGIDSSIELAIIPKDDPDAAGRGNTAGLYLDEFGFLKNIHIAYTPLSFVYSNYSRISRSNYAPAPFSITSTPADPVTPEGEMFMNLWNDATEITFEEIKYMLPHEIYEYVNQRTDNLLVKVYQYWYEFPGRCDPKLYDKNNENNILHMLEDPFVNLDELGEYDKNAVAYLKEVRSKCLTKTQLRREVYCEFLSVADQSIFDEDFLESIPRHKAEKTIKLPETIEGNLKIFNNLNDKERLNTNYALCVDPAYRVKGGDFAGIIVFNMDTMEVDATARIKVGKIKKVSKVVEYIFNTIYPNSLIIIEKNNFGQAIIEDLMETNNRIKNRIFYSYGSKSDRQIRNLTNLTREDSKIYGIQTDKGSRPKMIQSLKSYVENNPEKIKSPDLISELSSLQERKSSTSKEIRVEAAPGRHDDMVLALSFILYLLEYRDKDLSRFRKYSKETIQSIRKITSLNFVNLEEKEKKIKDSAYLTSDQFIEMSNSQSFAIYNSSDDYDSSDYGLGAFKEKTNTFSKMLNILNS